jgi:predicted nucleic acid-binding Zn ribbon protein
VEGVAGILDRLLGRLGLHDELHGQRAVEEWARIVGPRVARHTRALGFRDGVLRVEVDGSAWMHELSFLKRELIQRLNRELGAAPIRDVRWVVPGRGVSR